MRKPEDKSSGVFDHKWPSPFNVVIESFDLREIVMTGHQYTWAGSVVWTSLGPLPRWVPGPTTW
jgi:hypothetical protein